MAIAKDLWKKSDEIIEKINSPLPVFFKNELNFEKKRVGTIFAVESAMAHDLAKGPWPNTNEGLRGKMENESIAKSANVLASAKNIPLSVLAELTYQCNLHCYYCYTRPNPSRKGLSTVQWKKMLKDMAESGTLYLTLSGGELFMREDIFEIISEARKLSFAVSLISNGTRIDPEKARHLFDLGVLDVGVSFHAASAPLHDRLTGVPGSFAAAYKGLGLLAAFGIRTMIKHTVSAENFGEFRDLSRMAEEEGASFESDSLVVPHHGHRVSPFALSQAQHREFLEFMQMSPAPLSCKDHTEENLHCDAGRSLCGISPYGDVYPCIQLPVLLGNVTESSFGEIWKSNKTRVFRKEEKELKGECVPCGIRDYCARCPGVSQAESGDWQGASPSACARTKALASMPGMYDLSIERNTEKAEGVIANG